MEVELRLRPPRRRRFRCAPANAHTLGFPCVTHTRHDHHDTNPLIRGATTLKTIQSLLLKRFATCTVLFINLARRQATKKDATWASVVIYTRLFPTDTLRKRKGRSQQCSNPKDGAQNVTQSQNRSRGAHLALLFPSFAVTLVRSPSAAARPLDLGLLP